MGRTLMEQLAKFAGYCCSYNLLMHNKKVTTASLARRLGLAKGTVQHYRRALGAGKLEKCFRCPKVLYELRQLPKERKTKKKKS